MSDRVRLASWLQRTDVAVLAALVALTLAFGKGFSKVGAGGIYVTEVLIFVAGVAAVARLGARRGWSLASERVPATALLTFWALGAFALARGLADYGVGNVKYDVGMFEYSVLIPLVVLAVDSRDRLSLMLNAFGYGCVAGIVLSAMDRWLGDAVWPVTGPVPSALLTMMISFYFAWVVARLTQGVPTARFHLPLLLLGLVLLQLDERRTAWLAILLLIPLLSVTAQRLPSLRVAAIGGAVFLIAGVLAQVAPTGTIGSAEPGETPAQTADSPGGKQSVGGELRGTFSNDDSGQSSNADWRLDIWGFALENSVKNPAGVGFGRPMKFVWGGQGYDFRTGDPELVEFDVTGPHNDFVHYAYRMGWPALIAVIALVAIAVSRVWPWLRRSARGTEEAASAIALTAMLVTAIVFASLNDALKTPYMGIFFWVLLGLMLVFPWLVRERSATPLDGAHVEVPADAPLEGAGNGRRRDPAAAGEHA